MGRYSPDSSWNLPATANQLHAITRACLYLHIKEPLEEAKMTRREARDLLYELRNRWKLQVLMKRTIDKAGRGW